jgi:hypothetical protein
MKDAQPLFSSKIGCSKPHAVGFDSAHSENTIPTGGAPTRLSGLSEPTSRHVDPDLKSMVMLSLRVLERSGSGNASSIRFFPV